MHYVLNYVDLIINHSHVFNSDISAFIFKIPIYL